MANVCPFSNLASYDAKERMFANVCHFSNIASYIAKGAHVRSKHYQLFWSLKKVCPFSLHSGIT